MKNYITPDSASKEFLSKNSKQKELINTALYVIESLGIPFTGLGSRRLEKMALSFLAVIDVTNAEQWVNVKDLTTPRSMKTREIIQWINENFNEQISSGSYDDIRRKDLRFLVLAGIIVSTFPKAATNDSRRGYALNPMFTDLLKSTGTKKWEEELKKVLRNTTKLKDELEAKRNLEKIPLTLPQGLQLTLTQGEHNVLQKAIVEGFLSLYGYGSEVLYIGDTANKLLYIDEKKLKEFNFFELNHDELPDVIAYSREKNWLYLIEAVHSSGPISPSRLIELKRLTKSCPTDIIYVTAFLDRDTFRKFMADIAWETEVWIANNAEHLIHFNGHKFLSPYKK